MKAYEDRVLSEYLILEVQQMGGTGPAIAMAEVTRHNAAFEPKRMLDYMGRIHNIHGKFYEMTAAGRRQLARETASWRRFADAIQLVLQFA